MECSCVQLWVRTDVSRYANHNVPARHSPQPQAWNLRDEPPYFCVETTLNDPAQLLSLFLDGALGRSGRKRSRKAARFLRGNKGLVTASGLLAAAGVAWGIYDSLKRLRPVQPVPRVRPGRPPAGRHATVHRRAPGPAPSPAGVAMAGSIPALPPEVLRVVRLAVSAARADGDLSAPERALILEHARRAGVEADVEQRARASAAAR